MHVLALSNQECLDRSNIAIRGRHNPFAEFPGIKPRLTGCLPVQKSEV